ncbi:DUF2513 domain-containing protein [Erythrobacter litoralis]|uniref:DUF2513 domain-containing protein n=1 Tax=Erythrobacter litoralis TaxID=39960 RepID=UPI002435FE7A|nr:DUF2513 domain-containing protein [Erythrobacter litoralis]MDG6078584.1 DUF2513 domain-containing protein [Erythrobacter litoralis]
MKRDMETIRALLLWMEDQKEGLFLYSSLPEMPDATTTVEHIRMLVSGGFLEETPQRAFRISWEGHEFIDKVRDPEVWRKTKEGASRLGSWSVKLLGEMASGFIRVKANELGLPLG